MKKITVVLLLFVLILLVASCGTGSDKNLPDEETTDSTEASQEEATRARVSHSTLPAITNENDGNSDPETTQPSGSSDPEIITDGFFIPEWRMDGTGSSLSVIEDDPVQGEFPYAGLN